MCYAGGGPGGYFTTTGNLVSGTCGAGNNNPSGVGVAGTAGTGGAWRRVASGGNFSAAQAPRRHYLSVQRLCSGAQNGDDCFSALLSPYGRSSMGLCVKRDLA